jgi:ligand-binding sensor domain-containing protein
MKKIFLSTSKFIELIKKILFQHFSSLIILLIFTSLINGQDFIINQYRVQDGISQNQVYAVSEDLDGFLWVGTRKGLNRFDGVNFIKYYKGTHPVIHSHVIKDIEIDKNNTIWVACEFGFYGLQVDISGKVLIGFGPYIIDAQIFDIDVDENKILVSSDKGIFKFKNDKSDLVLKNTYFEDKHDEIFLFIEKINDNQYITSSTLDKYYLINNNNITKIKSHVQNGFDLINITDNNYIITSLDGLAQKNINNEIEQIKKINNIKIPYRIILDEDYGFWVGTYMDGLYLVNTDFTINHHFKSTQINDITNMHLDVNGTIWIATDGYGLYSIKISQFEKFDKSNGLSNQMIWSVEPNSRKNEIIVGTYTNIAMIQDNIITELPFQKYFYRNSINCIDVSKSNEIFIGTAHSFFKISNKRDSIYQIHSKYFSDDSGVMSLKFDNNNELWLGMDTYPNLIKYDGENWEPYSFSEGEIQNRVRKINFDSKNNLWFTTDYHLIKKNGIFWNNINFDGELVYDFVLINDSLLYVGTDAGLWMINKDFPEKLNLDIPIMTSIYSIQNDDLNNLWLGTDNGIYNYDILNDEIYHFGISDGLTELETNSRTLNFDLNGDLWIGTTRGVFKKNQSILQKKINQKCFIQNISFNDTTLTNFAKKEIKINEGEIEFNLIAINLKQNKNPIFKWRLLGQSDKWFISKSKNIRFSNLKYNDYVFQYQAVWSSQESTEIKDFHFTNDSDFLNSFLIKILFGIIFIISSIVILFFNNNSKKTNLIQLEINIFKPHIEIITKGISNGKSVFNSINARSILIIILLKKYIDNIGIHSDEINKIIWPKINDNKIRNRRNVTMSKIRKLFLILKNEDFIELKSNIYNINDKYLDFNCDLKTFMNNYELGETAKKVNNILDAIKYYQLCINCYNVIGICNPQKLELINDYNDKIKLLAISSAKYLINNENLCYDQDSIEKAKKII